MCLRGVVMTNVAVNKNNIELLSEKNVKKYVLPYYDLHNAKISQVKFKNTDKQRAVYKVSHKGIDYCLKKVYFPVGELLFVYSAVEWLYRYGIKVPRILSTINQSRYVSYENMLFILTPWIEGEKCDFDSVKHTLLTSGTLGKIHDVSKGFKPILGSEEKLGCSNLYSSQSKHFDNLKTYCNLAFKHNDTFSKIYLDNMESSFLLAKTANDISSTIKENNLSKSLCHNDYVSKNIIVSNNDVWLIDFDKCKYDYCSLDISYCLRRLLRRDTTKWNVDLTINFLQEYEKYNPLTLDDYKYILAYLAFPQKYWKISRDYYANISKCNKKAFISLIEKAIVQNNDQVIFVRKFMEYIEFKFDIKL
jgi:CotS family spore coat protein